MARRRPSALPYVLLLPAVVVLAAMLGYPLVRLVTLSLQEYGLPQVFGQPAPWVGLDNFRTILEDDYFWTVLWRTLIFCAVNVVLTMVLGVLIALLLEALGKGMRLFVSASLIIAWAMPALTATIVWQWIFDTEYGLVNWALGRQGESWWAQPADVLLRRHDHRRVDGHPVRGVHDLRRADPGPRGHRRGGQARRRPLPRHLPLRRVPGR